MVNYQHPIPLTEPTTWPHDHRTNTTHFKVAWNGNAKCNSHSSLLLCFYDLQSYEYGAQKLLPGHSLSQAKWHCISQHAKPRDRWAPLFKVAHAGCHFLLSFSSTMNEEAENSIVKFKGTWDWLNLGGQHSWCLYSHRFCLFLWLSHRQGKLRNTCYPR